MLRDEGKYSGKIYHIKNVNRLPLVSLFLESKYLLLHIAFCIITLHFFYTIAYRLGDDCVIRGTKDWRVENKFKK